MSGAGTERVERLRRALAERFAPLSLEVIDESHRHLGHAGAADGRGHFRVRIVAHAFAGQRPLARHRLVYAAVEPLLKSDVHALALETLAPDEL
jgi:BolA protein